MTPEVALQGHLDAINNGDPPTHDPPPYLANYRHPCKKARQSAKLGGKGVSTAIDLKERYVTLHDAAWLDGEPPAPPAPWLVDLLKDNPDLDLDDYAIIYREGKCKKCGEVARSSRGRVVLTSERPPITGRMSRT